MNLVTHYSNYYNNLLTDENLFLCLIESSRDEVVPRVVHVMSVDVQQSLQHVDVNHTPYLQPIMQCTAPLVRNGMGVSPWTLVYTTTGIFHNTLILQ